MSIKVVDLQNEEAKEEPPALETIEEEPKPVETPEVVNEVVEESNEEPIVEKTQRRNQTQSKTKSKWYSPMSWLLTKYDIQKSTLQS